MAYSDFTLRQLERTFDLSIHEQRGLFATTPPVTISDYLSMILAENVSLALAISTEKSRSEMIIAPMLIELRRLFKHRISLFSGIEFNVDSHHGLNGTCDYLVSNAEEQFFVKTPIIIIVEAKNENIKGGLAQCTASMLAAQLFNDQEGNALPCVYGAVTTGSTWKFLKLEQHTVCIDLDEYYIADVEKIMGILVSMVPQSHAL